MQQELGLIGRLDGPKAVSRAVVAACKTYRDAVRMAWQLKRVPGMTLQQLAGEAGLYASHVTDYLHKDDKPSRRDLPAHKVAEFESVVGNRVVSQWLAAQSCLTVLEEFQAERMAA
jgi:hypothetical protein